MSGAIATLASIVGDRAAFKCQRSCSPSCLPRQLRGKEYVGPNYSQYHLHPSYLFSLSLQHVLAVVRMVIWVGCSLRLADIA